MSGGTDFRDFGIFLNDSNNSMEFTKIDLKLNPKYINIVPLEDFVVFIGTNYKINNENNENNVLGEKCFKVLQNGKLVDLFICCNDYNIKKRKRIDHY
ncbi:hypothetical protein ABK040_008977 [Willaertia magna]